MAFEQLSVVQAGTLDRDDAVSPIQANQLLLELGPQIEPSGMASLNVIFRDADPYHLIIIVPAGRP